jgi:Galactose oxidase, central domain/Kelch motif
MTEVEAVLYATETAVKGSAISAHATSEATAPLHVRFHKLKSPSQELARSSHTLNIVKGKAYIFGGDLASGSSDPYMHVITLPADVSLGDVDYNRIEPKTAGNRPLEKYADQADPNADRTNHIPDSRAGHASAVVGEVIYVFGGRYPSESSAHLLREQGIMHAFDTMSETWSTIHPHPTKCSSGVPKARIYASMASTEHPLPGTAEEASVREHGTLFLHGGYDYHGTLMRDIWAFDVAGRVWSQWPSVPDVGAEEVPGEGKICRTESRLYRVGDGFGKVDWLDLVIDTIDDFSGKGEWGVGPKSGTWGMTVEKTQEKSEAKVATEPLKTPLTKVDDIPVSRKGYGMLPITTGAGREYLFMLLGEDGPGSMVRDVWSFQIRGETPAILKDTIRSAVKRQTGEKTWARSVVVESTKDEGPLEVQAGLSRFAVDDWRDMGAGRVVLWGGKNASGQHIADGWLLEIE